MNSHYLVTDPGSCWYWNWRLKISSSLVQKILNKVSKKLSRDDDEYRAKLAAELTVFNSVQDVHALPKIFQYWARRYLRPRFLEMGIRGVHEFFFDWMVAACKASESTQTIISIGSGHSEIEVTVAKMLAAAGHTNFVMECMDINEGMLNRARESATKEGVAAHMRFITGDASRWLPKRGTYSVVMAHQSLHHIVNLELLFEKIKLAIDSQGVFLTSDVIGRNGHMRWPEAMREIEKIWAAMPDRYKYNHALTRFEKMYENWDCSTEGFEGVRAQDILPLLRENFCFEMFLGYGNLIDIFIDRAFGHNFDPESEEDQRFIDMVAQLDEKMIEAGTIKPTHIVAVMTNTEVRTPRYYQHITPEFATRQPD